MRPADTVSALSSHRVGGECRVVTIGRPSIEAMATDRWCRVVVNQVEIGVLDGQQGVEVSVVLGDHLVGNR